MGSLMRTHNPFSAKGMRAERAHRILRNSMGPFLLPRCATSLRTGHLRGIRDFFQGTCPWKKYLDWGRGTEDCPLTGGLHPALQRDGSFVTPPLRCGGTKEPSLKSRLSRRNFPSSEEVGQRGRFLVAGAPRNRDCVGRGGAKPAPEPSRSRGGEVKRLSQRRKEPSPCNTGFKVMLDAALSPFIIPPSVNDAGRRGRRPLRQILKFSVLPQPLCHPTRPGR